MQIKIENVPGALQDLWMLRAFTRDDPNMAAEDLPIDGTAELWLEEMGLGLTPVSTLYQEIKSAEERRLAEIGPYHSKLMDRLKRWNEEEYLDKLCRGELEDELKDMAIQENHSALLEHPEKTGRYTPEELEDLKVLREVLKEDPLAEMNQFCVTDVASWEIPLAPIFREKLEKEEARLEEVSGAYGRMYMIRLKDTNPEEYLDRLCEKRLEPTMAEIDRQAKEMISRLEPQYAKAQGVTEDLKAKDPMTWTGLMNNIRAQIREEVIEALIN